MTRSDRLARAKALLAEEMPMARVAQEVGLPVSCLRRAAERGNWLRRTRRNPYPPEVRVEAINAVEATGSLTKAAQAVGIGRTVLARWLRAAQPRRRRAAIEWRCYDCAPSYGLRVEGTTCPGCGMVRFLRVEIDGR